MKTSFFSIGLMLLIISSSILSCKKTLNSSRNESITSSSHVITRSLASCGANPMNPFDYTGAMHNDGLDAIAANIDFPNLSDQQIHDIAYSSATASVSCDPLPFSIAQPFYSFYDNSVLPVEEFTSYAVNQGAISAQVQTKIIEIKDIVMNSDDPQDLTLLLTNFENQVVSDISFSPNEKIMILGTSSVARYSACYWSNAYLDASHPWHNFAMHLGEEDPASAGVGSNNKTRGLKSWWKKVTSTQKKNVVVADAVGFFGGAAIGFCGGMFFSGANPVVGAWAGAAFGVVVGTSMSALVAKK